MFHLLQKRTPPDRRQSGRGKRTAAQDIQPLRGDALIEPLCYYGERLRFANANVLIDNIVRRFILPSCLCEEIFAKFVSFYEC